MLAEQIIKELATAYSTFEAYQDRGTATIRSTGRHATTVRTRTLEFCTLFERPELFRFECRSRGQHDAWCHYVILGNGDTIRSRWDATRETEFWETLGDAVSGAVGATLGISRTVPGLLLPHRAGPSDLHDYTEMTFLDDSTIGGISCHRIAAKRPLSAPEEGLESTVAFWVERGSFLLRRIEEHVEIAEFKIHSVTDYEPDLSCNMSAEHHTFEFEPFARS